MEQFAAWVRQVHERQHGHSGQGGPGTASTGSRPSSYACIAANGARVLVDVVTALLRRQLAAQAEAFQQEGGFTERLYRQRKKKRGKER